MKTVGEFKKAGLVFVIGDVVDDDGNNDGSKMKPLLYWMVEHCNTGRYNYYHAKVESFAWRENTGVKPEFSGLVDVEFSDSKALTNCKARVLNWSGSDIVPSVIKWRPSLSKSSSSLEYDTKESAIHKALVALKGDLSNAKQYDENGSYLAVCIKDGFFIKEGIYCLTESLVENTEHWKDVCTVKEFTSYCEKMAAEEKRMDIIGQNGNDGLHYDNTAQQVEALAVNDKPIFTQAMACAGEFPLIGAKCVYVFMENGSEYTGSIAAIDGNVIWFKLDGGGYKTCFGVHKFKAVDNRTDREKAIDEMLELDLWATDREFLEAIYDAGYRKC